MSDYYQGLDEPFFDYDPNTVEGLDGRLFRGPAIDLGRPYIACIGAAQTYGRFCDEPFTHLLARKLGVQVLNLGLGGVGPRLFASPDFTAVLNRAEAVVVQVFSGRSAGNSLFNNYATASLMGTRLTDNKVMRFEQFLEDLFASETPERVREIVEETRESYVRETVDLLQKINAPRILLWISDREPGIVDDYSSVWSLLGSFPQLVNRPMIEAIAPFADAFVEATSSEGLPQRLWKADERIDGATVRDGYLFNHYYPSPEMHRYAADLLAPVCEQFVPPERTVGVKTTASVKRSKKTEPVRFVLLGAERSGTNLLMSMIDSHPQSCTGNEVFNPTFYEREEIPWFTVGMPSTPELVRLRLDDPVAFVRRLYELGSEAGHATTGFKLQYSQATLLPEVCDFLIDDESIRIIHLRRRNLLRRFVSERQASITDVWYQSTYDKAQAPPRVELDMSQCTADILDKEAHYKTFSGRLSGRRNVLELHYENMSDHPQLVGRRALRFLQMPEIGTLEIRSRKTGQESVRDAVTNYGDIKTRFLRWASYFDD